MITLGPVPGNRAKDWELGRDSVGLESLFSPANEGSASGKFVYLSQILTAVPGNRAKDRDLGEILSDSNP